MAAPSPVAPPCSTTAAVGHAALQQRYYRTRSLAAPLPPVAAPPPVAPLCSTAAADRSIRLPAALTAACSSRVDWLQLRLRGLAAPALCSLSAGPSQQSTMLLAAPVAAACSSRVNRL
nr:uncharacterized protein LOC127329171 [Lolium perenne]